MIASSFDHADPLLGGNEALFSLVKAARKSKIAVMGDLYIQSLRCWPSMAGKGKEG